MTALFRLGPTSNWYVLCGTDGDGNPAVSIRLLMPTRKREAEASNAEMYSTTKGITFDEYEWQKFIDLKDDIDKAVKNMEEL